MKCNVKIQKYKKFGDNLAICISNIILVQLLKRVRSKQMSNGQYSSHELQISSDQIILLAYYTKWNNAMIYV